MNWVRSIAISMCLMVAAGLLTGTVAHAQTQAQINSHTLSKSQAKPVVTGRYASIIIDANTLNILHARQIDALRHPASLTKIMTLYLTFEAIDQGRIALDDVVTVSASAAQTPPVSMGLKRAEPVKVRTLIEAVAVRSANDAAAVLAETVGGTEANFIQMMNEKAQQLGMKRTQFRNPHGLPNEAQVTTARDMAKLAVATLQTFPHHYHVFGQTHFRGQRNTNALLRSRSDVDGFKTGYTRASGYNLVISATQAENRLIAVVMGGASSGTRNQHMSDLIDRGFDVMAQTAPDKQSAASATATMTMARSPSQQPPGHANWALQIDGFASPAEAEILSATLVRAAGMGEVGQSRRQIGSSMDFGIRVNALDQATARKLCAHQSELLNITPRRCKVLSVAKPG
jgi:D-alanyl-D-alanine carboxypeptidase